jgi:hypothetical protein
MARRTLVMGASERIVKEMMMRIEGERKQVRSLIKGEIEKLMRMGAEITSMTYKSNATLNEERVCTKPEHMRTSFMQKGNVETIQKVHYSMSYHVVRMKMLCRDVKATWSMCARWWDGR